MKMKMISTAQMFQIPDEQQCKGTDKCNLVLLVQSVLGQQVLTFRAISGHCVCGGEGGQPLAKCYADEPVFKV